MRYILLLIIGLGIIPGVSAQGDSTKTVTCDTCHSVKKAVIFSAVLPGAGQIYNHLAMPKGQKKAFWKVPLIYAGLGASGYFMIYNNNMKNDLRSEYESRKKGNTPSAQFELYDNDGLLQLYSMHRTRRDLSILAFGIVYLLNVADAGVEAHFVHFDVSDDLTLSVQPVLLSGFSPGVGLRLNFR